jgi:hypothetical protein
MFNIKLPVNPLWLILCIWFHPVGILSFKATMYDVASFCAALKYVGSISVETLHNRTDLIFFGILNARSEFLAS